MILDASHKKWAIGCAVFAVVFAGVYAFSAWRISPVQMSGGSVAGLWFGILGTLLLFFAGLLPLRKWYPLARIGSAQSWLRAHIWLSLLGSFLILLHSAFHWRGTIEQVLMLLLALLVASGVWGLAAQSLLTRQLSMQAPLETFYENLPQTCRILQFEGDVLLARLCDQALPLAPDSEVATDERLKNRGVQGRDYAARLAKIYAPASKDAQTTPESPAIAEVAPAPVATAEPPVPTQAPVENKPLSAAEKIAMMRAKKAAPQPAATESESPAAIAAVPVEPAPVDTPVENKPLSAAEKIAMMRAKKAAPQPAATESESPAAIAAVPVEPAPVDTPAKALSTADKLKLMRAKKPAPAEASPATAAPDGAQGVVSAQPPLSTKDKLAMMRAGKSAAAGSAAPQPALEAAIPAAPRPLPVRTIPAAALKPFQQDLRAFFLDRVRPFLAVDRSRAEGGLYSEASSTIVFARLAAAMPEELHAPLRQLEELCDQRRQLSTQTRLYHWLHGWLVLVHIPAAAAMAGLSIVHIIASLYW